MHIKSVFFLAVDGSQKRIAWYNYINILSSKKVLNHADVVFDRPTILYSCRIMKIA